MEIFLKAPNKLSYNINKELWVNILHSYLQNQLLFLILMEYGTTIIFSHFGLRLMIFVANKGYLMKQKKGNNEIEISTKNFVLFIELKQGGEVSKIRMDGMGYLVKIIRDSIWQTKTFFNLPVFLVMNTSYDDESYWEDFPNRFMVSIYTKEKIALTSQYNY